MIFVLLGCMTGGDKDGINFPDDQSEEDETTEDTANDSPEEVNLCDSIYLLELSWDYSTEYIWRYDIETHTETQVGPLDCPKAIPGDVLVALSADSKGLLWAISDQSDVYAIRNDDLSCAYTQINASSSQPPFAGRSLAFLKQTSESEDELYFSGTVTFPPTDTTPAAIGKQYENTVTNITTISSLVGQNSMIDLAGTADGRLFGLRPDFGTTAILEIDPNAGTIIQEWPTEAPAPQGWSFVWHDNSFWMFVSADATTTEVYHFDPTTEILQLVNTLPIQVVGAALPSCAESSSGS